MPHTGRHFTAAIFDMDGLLLDSERPIRDAWLRQSAAAGTPLSEADHLLTVGRALLEQLKSQGVPLALAFSTRHAEVLRRLRLAGLLDFFACVHGGAQGGLAAGMGVVLVPVLVPDLKQADPSVAAPCQILPSLAQALALSPAWFAA